MRLPGSGVGPTILTVSMNENIPRLKIGTACTNEHDKLGWEAGFALQTDSGAIGVRTNNPELQETLSGPFRAEFTNSSETVTEHLVSFLHGESPSRRGIRNFHVVYSGCTVVARSPDLDQALWEYKLAVRKIAYPDEQESVYLRGAVYRDPESGKAIVCVGEPEEQIGMEPGALFESKLIRIDQQARIWPGEQRTKGYLPPGRLVLREGDFEKKPPSPGELLLTLLQMQWGVHFEPTKAIPILKRLIEESTLS